MYSFMANKLILVCEDCGSEDVQILQWVNPNTGENFGGTGEDRDDNWCDNCKEHTRLITKEEYIENQEENEL